MVRSICAECCGFWKAAISEAGPPEAQLSARELLEEAVRWEEAHRLPSDEGSGVAR